MAMNLYQECVEIVIPNSEACTFAQLKGIRDSSVTGYYIQDDPEKKQPFLDFFGSLDLECEIDINTLKQFKLDIKQKVYSSRFLFKGEMENLDNDFNLVIENQGKIPKIKYTGQTNRYLSFDNSNDIVKAFRNVLFGDITKIIIEKKDNKFIIKTFLLHNYLEKLCKKIKVNNIEELSQVLKTYYHDYQYAGIHLFGFDFAEVIKNHSFSIKQLVELAGIPESYVTEISKIIKLKQIINERNYKIDNCIEIKKEEHILDNDFSLIYQTNVDNKNFKYNRILFGAPGTGKSYTLNQEKDILLDNKNNYERITFHPDYSYANFVGTYKPVSLFNDNTKEREIDYKYVPGPFMRILVKALKSGRNVNPEIFLLIIEEINRANVAAVFGDVFQLLDRKNGFSEYPIQTTEDMRQYLADELGGTPNDYCEIRIPDNLFIWATMNSADQGVFPMDTAFKRRWDFTYLGIDYSQTNISNKNVLLNANGKQYTWNSIRKAINSCLSKLNVNEDKLLGPYFINMNSISSSEEFDSIFKDKVLMYLFEDAGRQKRSKIFKDNLKMYSEICDEYDTTKLNIFINDIIELADKYENEINNNHDNGDS